MELKEQLTKTWVKIRTSTLGDAHARMGSPRRLTQAQVESLQSPSAVRTIPVVMESMGGITVYVSCQERADQLKADDHAITATQEVIDRDTSWFLRP